MEHKDRSTGRGVLMVFAIVFSIIFVPILMALVPAGGMAITVTGMVSQEGIEKLLENAGISEELHELFLEEAMEEAAGGELRADVFERILKDCVKEKDIRKIVLLFVDAVYNGESEEEVDLSDIGERLNETVEEIYENGLDDLYEAWRYGAESEYFSENFVNRFFVDLENQFLGDYSEYGAISIEELEAKYEERYGADSFDRLIEDELNWRRGEWEDEVKNTISTEINRTVEEVEGMVKDAIREVTEDGDVNDMMSLVGEVTEKSNVVKVVVYALIFGIVLILLLLYWFDVAGFVVTAIPLLFGGMVCKLVGLAEKVVRSIIDRELFSEIKEGEKVQDMMQTLVQEILHPLFKGISSFGTIMLIAGVALIGGAILRGVLKKNNQGEEESYS